MNVNNIINTFAHKHRCSRFDQQRMVEALVLELSKLSATLEELLDKHD